MTADRKEILRQIIDIFIDVLDNDKIVLNDLSTAADIEEWNSLTHILLVVAMEKHFNIRFKSREIQSWNNIADMIDSIMSKLI